MGAIHSNAIARSAPVCPAFGVLRQSQDICSAKTACNQDAGAGHLNEETNRSRPAATCSITPSIGVVIAAVVTFWLLIRLRRGDMNNDSEPIRLDDPSHLPKPFLDRLARISPTIQRASSMDDLVEHWDYRSIARDVESFILKRKVRAYHCTRERYPGFFQERGLRPLCADDFERIEWDHHAAPANFVFFAAASIRRSISSSVSVPLPRANSAARPRTWRTICPSS